MADPRFFWWLHKALSQDNRTRKWGWQFCAKRSSRRIWLLSVFAVMSCGSSSSPPAKYPTITSRIAKEPKNIEPRTFVQKIPEIAYNLTAWGRAPKTKTRARKSLFCCRFSRLLMLLPPCRCGGLPSFSEFSKRQRATLRAPSVRDRIWIDQYTVEVRTERASNPHKSGLLRKANPYVVGRRSGLPHGWVMKFKASAIRAQKALYQLTSVIVYTPLDPSNFNGHTEIWKHRSVSTGFDTRLW